MGVKRLKSVWVVGERKIAVKNIQIPKPALGEVVVKVKACGICGTDIHFYNDFPEKNPTPLGHEVSGIVHELGEGVRSFSIGDRVIVQNHIPCGQCSSCLNGEYTLCNRIKTYMSDTPAMAEYMKVSADMLVHFSDLSFVEASFAEPVTVALDVSREAQLGGMRTVCVSGPGAIGLCCVKIARLSGAVSVAVLARRGSTARGRKRAKTAKTLGADTVFFTDEPDWKQKIKRAYPQGIERFIVTSPPATIPDTFEIAAFGGVIAFNGISYREENITFNANHFHFKKLKLRASHAIPNWGFPKAFQLLGDKQIPSELLVTHTFGLDEVERAFKTATSKDESVIKVAIIFD
jgi:L-iditol 2-dehydrogenase